MKAARVLVVGLVTGCAQPFGGGLVPGQSTASDVERLMGPAQERRAAAGGETVLWYADKSTGRGSYAARVGADGKLIAVEDRLSAENLNRLSPGVSKEGAVRDMLGPPHKVEVFAALPGPTWSYNMQGTNRQMVVQFSKDGVVRQAYVLDNPALVSAPE